MVLGDRRRQDRGHGAAEGDGRIFGEVVVWLALPVVMLAMQAQENKSQNIKVPYV